MSHYTLYWSKNTGAMAPQFLLALSGAHHEIRPVDMAHGEHRSEAYLRVNPYGQVPALQLPDGSIMTESAAMMLHLAEQFPATDMLPAIGTSERAQVQRWLVFLAANVYEAALRYHYSDRYTIDPAGGQAVRAAAGEALARQWSIIEGLLQPGPFLLGPRRSVFDLYVLMLSGWTDHAKSLPNVQRAGESLLRDATLRDVHAQHV